MKKYRLFIVLIIILALPIIFYLPDSNQLKLIKTTYSDIDEIDTIASFPDRGVFVLGLVRNGALGHFSYYMGICKQDKVNCKRIVRYEVDNSDGPWLISKDYIAFIRKSEELNFGWFEMKNGKLISQRQMGTEFEDTMKLNTANFKYYLYKYNNRRLQIISDRPDDILKQKDGLFFIPSPGIGIKNLYRKEEVFNTIDSLFCLGEIPEKIEINPVILKNYIHKQ